MRTSEPHFLDVTEAFMRAGTAVGILGEEFDAEAFEEWGDAWEEVVGEVVAEC